MLGLPSRGGSAVGGSTCHLQHKRLAMAADKGGIEAARAARIQIRLCRQVVYSVLTQGIHAYVCMLITTSPTSIVKR